MFYLSLYIILPLCRWHVSVRVALTRHRGIQRVGKVGQQTFWRLLPEAEWLELKPRPAKKPAPTATPFLGAHARSPT